MTLLRFSEKPIEKVYYNLKEACQIINEELNLKGKDTIISSSIAGWKKKGLIHYNNSVKITKQELDQVKGLVYLHCFLGISYSRLRFTQEYLNQIIFFKEESLKLHKYINLYHDRNS